MNSGFSVIEQVAGKLAGPKGPDFDGIRGVGQFLFGTSCFLVVLDSILDSMLNSILESMLGST